MGENLGGGHSGVAGVVRVVAMMTARELRERSRRFRVEEKRKGFRVEIHAVVSQAVAMKVFAVFAFTLSAVYGQADVSKLLSQGLRGAVSLFEPVAETDQKAILSATAEVLAKHVTFRPDGTASSVCAKVGKQHVEWRRLVVRSITKQPVTDADRLNGVTSRFMVGLSCDAHRTFDSKTSRWGEWRNSGYILFPSGLEFEWKKGGWVLKSESLEGFTPGQGPSIADLKPATGDATLPPGMKRGK